MVIRSELEHDKAVTELASITALLWRHQDRVRLAELKAAIDAWECVTSNSVRNRRSPPNPTMRAAKTVGHGNVR
jgi:hypothetical protein